MKQIKLNSSGPADPFPNPVLCPTDAGGTNTNGARFGCSRAAGSQWHGGTDLKADVGTKFSAIYSGQVPVGGIRDLPPDDADYKKGVGNFVIVRSDQFSIKYCHLSKIDVSVGDTISEGDVLGSTGRSGNAYDVPFKHLHVEISTDHFATSKNYVDPEPYLKTKYTPANPNSANHDDCPAVLNILEEEQDMGHFIEIELGEDDMNFPFTIIDISHNTSAKLVFFSLMFQGLVRSQTSSNLALSIYLSGVKKVLNIKESATLVANWYAGASNEGEIEVTFKNPDDKKTIQRVLKFEMVNWMPQPIDGGDSFGMSLRYLGLNGLNSNERYLVEEIKFNGYVRIALAYL